MDSFTVLNIKKHISNVQNKINFLIEELQKRRDEHDKSKLENELELWERLDNEPQYPYGTKEYFDKKIRNNQVFKMHYEVNRHHPEHFVNGVSDMNLIDILEMLCDWISYKDDISITEAISIIEEQSKRFGFSDELINLMTNTLIDYFATFRYNSCNISNIFCDNEI